MKIVQTDSPFTRKAFLKVPRVIYRNDPHWISHIDQEIRAVFNPRKNQTFRNGDAARWIVVDDQGDLIGRVAAFIDRKQAERFDPPTGGMGFFDCVDDREAAFMLFDTCRNWLQERGMEAMDGPINFGENDRYWGLITENFSHPPYYHQNYNPSYYVDLFEDYGFRVYYEQLIYWRTLAGTLDEKHLKNAERFRHDPEYEIRRFDKKRFRECAEDFRTVFNRAWGGRDGEIFKSLSKERAVEIVRSMKPMIDEDLIWYAYHRGRPIAFLITLPEVNQIMRFIDGNLSLIGKLKFLWHRSRTPCTSVFGIAFGIDPDYQGQGLAGALFKAFGDWAVERGQYHDVILAWIGDFNPRMIHIIGSLGTSLFRKMATYRMLFDKEVEFVRRPIIP